MNRFLATILSAFLLLPMCGGVWTFLENEVAGAVHHIGQHSTTDGTLARNGMHWSPIAWHPHFENTSADGCCGKGHGVAEIGRVERKIDTAIIVASALSNPFVSSEAGSHAPASFKDHAPAAPPEDRHAYATLTGVVKNLN